MMPPHLRPVLRQVEAALHVAFGGRLRDVQLFGSYARGEATEESDVDVDVLVLIDGFAPSEIALVSDCATAVALTTGVALAPLPLATEAFERMSAEGRVLASEIARDGTRS